MESQINLVCSEDESSDTLYHSRNRVLIHHQKVASEIFFGFLIQIHDTILELNAIYVA